MSNIAILGHETRGKEVIEILEMLGGKHKTFSDGLKWFNGINVHTYYTIEEDNYIHQILDSGKGDYIKFTLEEFLEKFPYKVGDYARLPHTNIAAIIKAMKWENNEVVYQLYCSDDWWSVDNLKQYKEETMEEKEEKSANHVFDTEIISFDIAQRDKYELDLQGKFKVVLREGVYYVERIKPQYPKNYKECCKIVNASPYVKLVYNISDGHNYSYDEDNLQLHENIRRLKICRDAYWKIVGEQMGLGKPWEPDWSSFSEGSYPTITKCNGKIIKTSIYTNDCFLAFPSEEMRDVFYENFKKEIEECKELL